MIGPVLSVDKIKLHLDSNLNAYCSLCLHWQNFASTPSEGKPSTSTTAQLLLLCHAQIRVYAVKNTLQLMHKQTWNAPWRVWIFGTRFLAAGFHGCGLSSSCCRRCARSVTLGMLPQREWLMNVENENTSLMNSVTQLVQLIFLWHHWVKWSHGWST